MDIKTLAKQPTFRDLLNILGEMPEENLDKNLMVYDVDYDGFVAIESIGEMHGDKNIEDGTIVFSIGDKQSCLR